MASRYEWDDPTTENKVTYVALVGQMLNEDATTVSLIRYDFIDVLRGEQPLLDESFTVNATTYFEGKWIAMDPGAQVRPCATIDGLTAIHQPEDRVAQVLSRLLVSAGLVKS